MAQTSADRTDTLAQENCGIDVEEFMRESGVLRRIQQQAFDCDIKRRAKQHGFEVLKISHRHDQAKLGKTELDNWLKFASINPMKVTALATAVKISSERYVAGKASYYEVLEAQQQLFPSQINLARTQRDQLLAVVTLYKDLGGGWQDELKPNPHP